MRQARQRDKKTSTHTRHTQATKTITAGLSSYHDCPIPGRKGGNEGEGARALETQPARRESVAATFTCFYDVLIAPYGVLRNYSSCCSVEALFFTTCVEVEAARRTGRGRNGTHASASVQRHKCTSSPFTLAAARPRAARSEKRREGGKEGRDRSCVVSLSDGPTRRLGA